MDIAKEIFYMELESYIKSGNSAYLDRIVNMASIDSIDEAKKLLCIMFPNEPYDAISRGAIFLYNMSKAQHETRFIDTLTGLYNYNYLSHIEKSIQYTDFQVLFFDLDNMKVINDTLGHEQGNTLIKFFAHLLVNCFRPTDTICRYGGDEFVAIAYKGHLTEGEIQIRIEKYINDVNCELPISFSFGSALNSSRSLTKTIREADNAMYHMKSSKKCKCLK